MALLIGELSVPADCEVAFYHREILVTRNLSGLTATSPMRGGLPHGSPHRRSVSAG